MNPNIHEPWAAWSAEQTLHVATCYINPLRWRTRRELLNNFRHHMQTSCNVKLYVVEVQFGERPFEVTSSANPNDLQLRTRHELWLKENALNLMVQRFAPDWKYGAIVDGDFTFNRRDWALEAIHCLQHYDWVQLFSNYANMSHECRPNRLSSSFAHNYIHRRSECFGPKGKGTDGYSETGEWPKYPGAPGGAWAFTRESFTAVGGLLDKCILGSGDWHMAFGLVGQADEHVEMKKAAPGYVNAIRTWQERAYAAVRGNIGCIDCHAVHSWHGSMISRNYGSRPQVLINNKVDPATDFYRDWQGLYQLTPVKPRLRDEIRRYFSARNEDSITMEKHEKHLV